MSSRFYPRYVRGNPQLRIFLPDWKMILVKNKEGLPNDVVTFKTDVKMTDWDIRNYLEKIYKVKVAGINSRIIAGALRKSTIGLSKHEDYRIAHVSLSDGQQFEWPKLFPSDKRDQEIEEYKRTIDALNKDRKIDLNKSGAPSWFV